MVHKTFILGKSKSLNILQLCGACHPKMVCTLSGEPIATVLKVLLLPDHSKYLFRTASDIKPLWDPRELQSR